MFGSCVCEQSRVMNNIVGQDDAGIVINGYNRVADCVENKEQPYCIIVCAIHPSICLCPFLLVQSKGMSTILLPPV